MQTILLDAVVRTDYGQFDLVWDAGYIGFGGDYGEVFGGQVNGLVGAASGRGMYMNLAHRYGGSALRIELHDQAPAVDDSSWEDIVEVSVVVPAGSGPQWQTWNSDHEGPLDLPGGSYRARISARNRDLASAWPGKVESTDTYLIEFWPALAAPDEVVKVGSADAKYWHETNGGHRWPLLAR
jgi:hypothetical protein